MKFKDVVIFLFLYYIGVGKIFYGWLIIVFFNKVCIVLFYFWFKFWILNWEKLIFEVVRFVYWN